ncbi:MAG: hypothetical protein ACI9XO_000369 [Paraglaciecola sp.]|jgi:hypothetical protein
MQNTIEISLSKGKLLLMLLGCIGFVVGSIWLFNFAETQEDYAPTLLKGVGGVGFVFFGLAGLFVLKKLTDKKPGLTINYQGIIENTNGISVQMVEWKDITDIEAITISGQNLILVKVKKPEKYVEKASNNAQKRLLRLNVTQYGTPIFITTNSLEVGFEELLELLNGEFEKRRKRK